MAAAIAWLGTCAAATAWPAARAADRGSLVLQCTACRGMGIQRCLAYFGHPEHAGLHPVTTSLNRQTRAIVFGELCFEQRQDALGTVAGPGCNSSVVGGSGKVGNLPVETGFDELRCVHVAS